MSAIRLSVAALFAAAALLAQSNSGRPEFEVASIKPSPAQMPNQAAIGLHIDGAQVRCNYLPLREYLGLAFRLRPNQISGPDWIASDRFDIVAKIPAGLRPEQTPEMLQALLEDRFRLKSHRDTKEFPVYGLVVAKGGLKIQALPPDPEDDVRRPLDVGATGGIGGVNINFGRGAGFSLAAGKIDVKKLTMREFADALTRFADRPVVNMTDAPGKYNFTVTMTPEDYGALLIRSALNAGVTLPPEALRMVEGVSGESQFLSLQTVGLKIESRKAPLDVLIVDSVLKTPTAN